MFPKLRFKEFDGDWLKLKYKDVLTIKYGKDHKSLNDGDIPVYGTGGLMRHVNKYLYDGESILIGRKGTIDKPKYINEKFWTVDTLFYTEIEESIVPLFLYQHALEVNWLGLNEATGVPSLNTTSIYNIDISIPSKEEQNKIASFLSVVDEKISQFNQKHELLSQYKQGMMQKLFSQQIRFKADDGSEFGEWQENQLLDLSTKKSSKVTAKDIEDNDGDYIVFGASGHFRNINSYTESEPYIAIVKDGAGAGRLFLMPEKSSVLGTLEIVKPNLNIQLNFLFYRMQLIDFSSYIKGSTIPHVYFKDYSQEKIYLPCLEEQTKIANFLSAIDQKIEVVAQQIEQAKTWKKGLLQQMFI